MSRLKQVEEVDQKYAKKDKDDIHTSTKFFVFVDYLFLLIFFLFLCFILSTCSALRFMIPYYQSFSNLSTSTFDKVFKTGKCMGLGIGALLVLVVESGTGVIDFSHYCLRGCRIGSINIVEQTRAKSEVSIWNFKERDVLGVRIVQRHLVKLTSIRGSVGSSKFGILVVTPGVILDYNTFRQKCRICMLKM